MNTKLNNAFIGNWLLILLLICSNTVYAKKNITKYRSELKEVALRTCLNINYERLGVYKKENMKDFSDISYSFNVNEREALDVEALGKLYDFVEKNAGKFYTGDAPIHLEITPPPYNTIFADCMKFYRSKKLDRYINSIRFY